MKDVPGMPTRQGSRAARRTDLFRCRSAHRLD
uniref:Uncharacterized protein n=1 Tax=Arundo donax TaxID=35708 RepID=A0A0A9F5U6_ARUDO